MSCFGVIIKNLIFISILVLSCLSSFAQTYTKFNLLTEKKTTDSSKVNVTQIQFEPLSDEDDLGIAAKVASDDSCGRIQGGMTNGFKIASENFMFLSLNEFKSDSAKTRLEFFKDVSLKGSPTYILDNKGLSKNNKVVCAWNPNRDSLMSLEGCYDDFKSFIGYLHRDEDNYCSVLNVKNVIQVGGKRVTEVEIGKEKLFIDYDAFYWTKEYRAKAAYESKVLNTTKYVNLLIKIKNNKAFSRLQDCYVLKDVKCVLSFVPERFKNEIKSFCGEEYSEIVVNKHISKYIKEFINLVNFFQVSKLETGMVGDIENKIYFKPEEHHAGETAEPKIGVSLKGESLEFDSFYYGVSC